MKTLVEINLFKQSGKWYTDLKYESNISIGDIENLKKEVEEKIHIKYMSYTVDFNCLSTKAWSRYLILKYKLL